MTIRHVDGQAVRSSLASIATVHDDRNGLLFAAVSQAMEHGSKSQSAQLLQRILEKHKDDLPPEIEVFALLR